MRGLLTVAAPGGRDAFDPAWGWRLHPQLAVRPEPLLNMCGTGRVVCLIDPVGDVYARPFAIDDRSLARNMLSDSGFDNIWKNAPLFRKLREPQSAGACASCGHFDSCRVAAWRPSSSPACRWPVRTRSACKATAPPLCRSTERGRGPAAITPAGGPFR